MSKTPVALDSCVVIGMLDKPAVASGLKARLRGKSVRTILCGGDGKNSYEPDSADPAQCGKFEAAPSKASCNQNFGGIAEHARGWFR